MMQELDQELVNKYYTRGLEHSRKGELELAIENYTRAIKLKPDYAEAYYNRAGAYLRLGERGKAKSDIVTARDLGMSDIIALDEILRDHDRAWKTLGNI